MLANNNDKQNNLLNRVSYCNLKGNYKKGDNLITVLRTSGYNELADELKKEGLSHLVLKDYVNENGSNGFVAIAFEDPRTGECGMSFRGTENLPEIIGDSDKLLSGDKEAIKKHIDMLDNVPNALTGDSPQVERALAFYKRNRNPNGDNYLYGHSKGGELAAEVFAEYHQEIRQVHVVNAQPINPNDLTAKQIQAFRSGKFDAIVIDGDIVSWLGPAPYPVRIVKNNKSQKGLFGPHDLKSVYYKDGNAVIEPYPYKDYPGQGFIATLAFEFITVMQFHMHRAEKFQEITDKITQFLTEDLPVFLMKAYDYLTITYQKLKNKFIDFCEDVDNFFESVGHSIKTFVKTYSSWGGYVAAHNPSIIVDPTKLDLYASRLTNVNRRIRSVDRRLDSLYFDVGIKNLWNLVQADALTDYSFRLNQCINYLTHTASDFKTAENAIKNKA
ncbi:MAG: DUF2974 domain-containing protein [Clostridia bacterium]|nr:DUF2974 domain-containing protein [Clostridia bacterium]